MAILCAALGCTVVVVGCTATDCTDLDREAHLGVLARDIVVPVHHLLLLVVEGPAQRERKRNRDRERTETESDRQAANRHENETNASAKQHRISNKAK